MAPTTAAPLANRVSPRIGRAAILRRSSSRETRPFPYSLAAGLLLAAWVVLNLAYLMLDCPLDLAPDEAHYWHWSRRLDWSYFSKGPLVALLIRGSCDLFGGLSVYLVGSEMLAVRLPAVLSNAALLAGLYVLAVDVLRDRRAAFWLIAFAMAMPGTSTAAVLMTIDAPLLACWCWALASVKKAIARGSFSWWVLAGVCAALGVLAKYSMLFFPFAAIGFVLAKRREELRRPGLWAFLGIAWAGCVPILIWNAMHDWVSFRHVLWQSGLGAGVKPMAYRWLSPVAFAGGQFALLLGVGFIAFAAGARRFRRTSDIGLSLMWWASVPVWCAFLLACLRTPGQLNWAAPAYIGGAVLGAAWMKERLESPRRRPLIAAFTIIAGFGLAISVGLRYPRLGQPLLLWLVRAEANPVVLGGTGFQPVQGANTGWKPVPPGNAIPLRQVDPTCRLRGWRTLAAEVDATRDRVKAQTGSEPVVAAMVWTMPGELAFYCRGHPEVHSFGSALADRPSQYDLWHPNPVADAQVFRGRSFVYVGDEIPNAALVYESVEPPIRVVHAEDGVPVAKWTIWVGHGYRGFPR